MNEGFYIGKINKNIISNYIVLLKIKDSTAILETYIDEKGMSTAYSIFNNKQIMPFSECFQFYKEDKCYVFFNSLNKFTILQSNGSFVMESPLIVKFKYYKNDPINLYPSKKYVLYCYCWFYPHVILGMNEKFNTHCEVYIQNRMDKNLKNIGKNLNYDEYFTMLKDSILQYKLSFDNISK